ncbi:MAG: hypothetical protein Q8M01_02950 [Rubrivivax sp.]|nr:hypothetical protein [Rubrivivax sp.]
MNERPQDTPEMTPELAPKSEVDHGRRRLGTLGVGGTAVVLSVTSRSAVAGWGTCTGSEIASGNLSRVGSANPCGCSPGYWWNDNGTTLWESSPTLYARFPRTEKFNMVFGVNYYTDPSVTLAQVGLGTSLPTTVTVTSNGNGLVNVGMHAVAALLNAQFYGDRYPAPYKTASTVITAFRTAFSSLDPVNALKGFVSAVDVYVAGVWCNGEEKR